MKERMLALFQRIYGDNRDVSIYFAPGRVNLIGEHTDYNGGHVFPCALTMGTYLAIRKNRSQQCRFYSDNYSGFGVIETDLSQKVKDQSKNWTNYPMAVAHTLTEKGFSISEGFDAVYYGNIPNASGLSSSASVEVVTAFALKDLFELPISGIEIALLTQYAENNFIGVNCGIMDQFSSAMGKKDNAIFLNTGNLEYEYVKLCLPDAKIVIANTNKKRGLGDSKYNERRSECERALAEIKNVIKIDALGDLTEAQFDEIQTAVSDPICRKRAKHAVYENQRTVRAVDVLLKEDVSAFGQLMNASHVSLRDDYEVTGTELDTLVEAAWAVPGVIGARMTGAGFGGCTVSLVKNNAVDTFIQDVGEVYEEKIGYPASFYIAQIGDGPYKL